MARNFQGPTSSRFAGGCLAGLLAGFTVATSLAFADSPDEILAKRGLKASGWVYVLDAETPFSTEMAEAKGIFQQLKQAQDRLDEQLDHQAMIDELTAQSNALKADLADGKQLAAKPNLNQQFGGYGQNAFVPQGRFATGAGFGQNAFTPQFQNNQNMQLTAQLAQGEQTLSQMNDEIGRLRRLGLAPEESLKLQAESKKHLDKLRTMTLDLRKSADAISEQYKGLRNEPAVTQAIAALGQTSKAKPKLGPSKTFQADLKTLEKMERTLATGGVRVAKSSKATRKHKSRSTATSKKSTPRKSATP